MRMHHVVFAVLAFAVTAGTGNAQPPAMPPPHDPNDYPNPYHVEEGWAKLGRHLWRRLGGGHGPGRQERVGVRALRQRR